MNKYDYTIRRIVRKCNYERWLLYISEGEEDLYVDTVFIVFYTDYCEVTLIMHDRELLKNDDKYGTTLEGIYHDIGVLEEDVYQFKLDVKELSEVALSDEDIEDEETEKIINSIIENLKKI